MKIYGADICIDCRNAKAVFATRGLELEFVDITENTTNLKEFLALRDKETLFDPVRERGGIGIPCFVNADGTLSLNLDEAMSWIGQPPVAQEELPEKREEGGCSTCN
jgi:glutaredoxin-related protein